MATTQKNLLHLPILISLLSILFTISFASPTLMYPMNCSTQINTCSSSLYHIINNNNLQLQKVASFYSVTTFQIQPITHDANKQDYLINVPCSCKNINGTTAYFFDTVYTVQPNDTFLEVSNEIYSGQVWNVGGEETSFVAGAEVLMHLLCGCVEKESERRIVSYTVQVADTLSQIATLLSANVSEIVSLNSMLIQNPNFLDVGWVLFVPMGKN